MGGSSGGIQELTGGHRLRIAGDQQYILTTLPGEQFSGLEPLCLQYVGFQLTHPEIDTKIPLGQTCRQAKAMFDKGTQG